MDFKNIVDKVEDAVAKNKDKIDQGLDKAADVAKNKMPGKSDQIDKAVDAVKDKVEKTEAD